MQQDHIQPDLLFIGAETGVYVTVNRGEDWHKLAGAPTIAFRDIKIQRRDSDLVCASFGRGFYVLDDYSPLREMGGDGLNQAGGLMPVRDAWWYVPQTPSQSVGMPTMGVTSYKTPNPEFGATLNVWLQKDAQTAKEARNAAEKKGRASGENADFPGWETLRDEINESDPVLMVVIKDENGTPVRRLSHPAKAGMHRIAWDLRLEPPDPIRLKKPDFNYPWESAPMGALVPPGSYSAELMLVADGKVKTLGDPQCFAVKVVPTTVEGTDFGNVAAFQKEVSDLMIGLSGVSREIARAHDRLKHVRMAILATPAADMKGLKRIDKMAAELRSISAEVSQDEARAKLDEPAATPLMERMWLMVYGSWRTRQEPTATMRRSLEVADAKFGDIKKRLTKVIDKDLAKLEKDVSAAGGPWTPGRKL